MTREMMAECPNCGFPVGSTEKFCGRCGTQLDAAQPGNDPMLGVIIADRYRIQGKIGEGSQGIVYRCEHVRMNKVMAIKVLRPELSQSQELVRRFHREARAVSQLSNSHTVNVFDFGIHGIDSIYIVTEYLRGVDLGTLLREVGPLSFPRAANMIVQACESLSEAHQLDLLHLDLKPENLFLSRTRNGEDFIKVLDYGLAKLTEQGGVAALSEAGRFHGSPLYLSPEQIRGEELDGRSDIYSLGAVLYRMVTGSAPFGARTAIGILEQHLDGALPDPCATFPSLNLHSEVRRVLERAMAKDPERRYSGIDALRADLLAAVDRIKADEPAPALSPPLRPTPLVRPHPEPSPAPGRSVVSPGNGRRENGSGTAGQGGQSSAAGDDEPGEPAPSAAAGEPPRPGRSPGGAASPAPSSSWDTRQLSDVPGELLGTRQDVQLFETRALVRQSLRRYAPFLGVLLLALGIAVALWLSSH